MSRNVRKRMFWNIHPAESQISLRIRAVWSESSLGAFRIDENAKTLHADNEDSVLSLRWAHTSKAKFSHVAAHI